MILKRSDERRDDLAKLTLLASRCDAAQKRRLDSEYKKLVVGSQGERDVAHVLNRIYGESDRTAVLHDLRIGVRGEYAQIDHLVVHRGQGRIWLCETKNYGGRLQCNSHGEWTVWYGRQPQPVPSPIEQARLQAIVLRRWLQANNYAYLEVMPLVLIAPTASVDRRHVPDDVTIVKWDQFGNWWERQADELSALAMLKMSASAFWEKRDAAWLRVLGEKLCEAHTPIVFDWEARLGLDRMPAANEHAGGRRNIHPLRAGVENSHSGRVSPTKSPLDLSPLVTPHGNIEFRALGDTEVAIRNPPVEPLIEIVRGTVKGQGRWQPRFKNWIVKVDDFETVRCQIEARLTQAKDRWRA
jgi:hypothetical protein